MCYNIAVASKKEIKTLVGLGIEVNASEKEVHTLSGFSSPKIPVLTVGDPMQVQLFNWGLIPAWCKDETQANEMRLNTLNAKTETVFEKPSFRASIDKKRCLIFVNGFYEWRDVKKKKYPYYIHLKDQEAFALGGIYETWLNKETGELTDSCSIITTEANPLMAMIHNSKKRMPLIFEKERMFNWLKNDASKEEIKNLMQPLDEKFMEAHTISKLISNRTLNPDVPEVKKEFIYPELFSLF
jgi:putative SOS response-associated peptidase YedK